MGFWDIFKQVLPYILGRWIHDRLFKKAKPEYVEVFNPQRGYVGFQTTRVLKEEELLFIAEKGDANNMPKGTKFVAVFTTTMEERLKELADDEAKR